MGNMKASSSTGRWDRGTTAFRRGWWASSDPELPEVFTKWTRLRAGELEVRVHPALSWALAEDAGQTVVLLGDVVDLERDDTTDGAEVARRILMLLKNSIDDAVRAVAYLGGRFACLLATPGETRVVPDCVGSLPIFWHQGPRGVTLGSYSHLVAELTGAQPDEKAIGLLRKARAMDTKGTLYLPGTMTPFTEVRPVFPNNLLRLREGRVSHERFYPFPDLVLETNTEEAYQRYATMFRRHTRALASLGRVGISLTAGRDSQASLAALLSSTPADEVLTWTYYTFSKPHEGLRQDLLDANKLALSLGLRHQVIAVGETSDVKFGKAYERTMRYTQQFRALAEAYHSQLPHDIVEMQSMVAEVGSGFYKNREVGSPTLERLSYLFSPSDFGSLPEVRDAIADYMDYANFAPADFGPVDYHDLYYWETRIGRWGCLRMQEVDLSHHLVLPFNSRHVVEALMGPSLEKRVDKQALVRFTVEEMASEQASPERASLRNRFGRLFRSQRV